MDRVYELISEVKGQARGNFLGLLNVLIGRHITKADGTPVSQGLTWRELAAVLKKLSWEKEWVRELGLDPSELTPRDRGSSGTRPSIGPRSTLPRPTKPATEWPKCSRPPATSSARAPKRPDHPLNSTILIHRLER